MMEHDYIVYKKNGCFDDPVRSGWTAISYSFLRPAVLSIKRPDGNIEKIGYGIGETISVLEPRLQTLQSLSEVLNEIPLEDGSFITHWPKDLKTTRVY